MKDYYPTDVPWKGKTVKNAVIEDGVTAIGNYAFANCSYLTSVSIPDSVTTIGNSAFSACSSLTSVSIPEVVTRISSYAFYQCSSLTSVSIPDGVTTIGGAAFEECSNLISITIPDRVTIIFDYAFYKCNKLSKILVPNSVKAIGISAIPNGATIYCYKNSSADNWARQNGNSVFYLDDSVTNDILSLTLPDELSRLTSGDSRQLTVNVFPATAVGEITWNSSNPAVASVADGLVKALTPGTATITATAANGVSGSIEITVVCAEHTVVTD